MERKPKEYYGKKITVTFDIHRCTHVGECTARLPQVFDTDKRPWITPDNSTADKLSEVILRCPTGALHFTRLDGGPQEPVPSRNVVTILPDGPAYIDGNIEILNPAGELLMKENRIALCRCGKTAIRPFCDETHTAIEFQEKGQIGSSRLIEGETDEGGVITVRMTEAGPWRLSGKFTLKTEDGRQVFHGERCSICSCGKTKNQPFCDSSHRELY